MQMSQLELLRSLLYQISRQCLELIIDVFQETGERSYRLPSTWTFPRLLNAFEQRNYQTIKLAEQKALPIEANTVSLEHCSPNQDMPFHRRTRPVCGKLSEIIQLLRKPTTSKPVKICLSSGAWNVS